jgi:prophage antirepressor-like protein
MKDLKIWNEFFNEEDSVNIIQLDDEGFWFQFSHLAKILDYKNPTVALQTHCEDYEIKKLDIGQHEQVNFVSESGFYSLVLGSKKPQAKKFKQWVCSKILPKLRASGGYIMPEATSEQLKHLIEDNAELREEMKDYAKQFMYRHQQNSLELAHARIRNRAYHTVIKRLKKQYPSANSYLEKNEIKNLEAEFAAQDIDVSIAKGYATIIQPTGWLYLESTYQLLPNDAPITVDDLLRYELRTA